MLAALLLGRASAPGAQEALSTLPEGGRIRITAPVLAEPTIAVFRGLESDAILASIPPGDTVRIALSVIQRLEVPRKSRTGGAWVGAPIGVLVGTLVLGTWGQSQGGFLDCGGCSSGGDFLFAAVYGGPVGGVLGGVAGALIGRTRWDPLPGFPARPAR